MKSSFKKKLFVSLTIIMFTGNLSAQSVEDSTAILNSALDYGDGWYEGNAERMERALHPELAKRMILTNPTTGRSKFNDQGAMTLVQYTRRGGGKKVSNAESTATIMEIFGNVAMVKVDGPQWIDYLQMAKWNGKWVIINVLWELKPPTKEKSLNR